MGAERKHSAGWYAGALVFWLLCAWLITVGLSSIIPQIFWPAGDVRAEAGSCAPNLRQLRRELAEHMSDAFARAPGYAAERAWFERWDGELARARPACQPSEREAFSELNRLRYGMQTLLERFEREQAPRMQRLDELLGAAQEARARPPAGENEQP